MTTIETKKGIIYPIYMWKSVVQTQIGDIPPGRFVTAVLLNSEDTYNTVNVHRTEATP